MAPRQTIAARLNALLARRLGVALSRVERRHAPARFEAALPAGAREHLRPDHPELLDLEARYKTFEPRVTRPLVWRAHRVSDEDLLSFRGDNAFVWQVRGPNRTEAGYALCYYQLRSTPAGALLGRLSEDGLFGAHAFEIDGRLVTRDLLDSVGEIEFLTRHLGIDRGAWNILDIGAGYGRLAHRLDELGHEGLEVYATDAFARSTFLCRYYLGFRGARRARAVPLDEVDSLFQRTQIQIATNVHSFSECTADAVDWWLGRLARHGVPWLMVVPNEGSSGGARCEGNDGTDQEAIFERHGYRLRVREPRYRDPVVQKHGVDPVWLHLFALEGRGGG